MFRKVARPMLASVYIADGVDTLINTEAHVAGTEAVLSGVEKVVPSQYSVFVPRDPELVARAMGGMKVVAGSTLALGKAQRLSAAALAVASIPTLLGRYAFWSADDASDKSAKRSGFLTHVGLLGGLLITVSDTQGKPGVAWRTRHAAKVAKKEVQRALPGKSDTEKLLANAGDRVSTYADTAKTFAATGAAKAGATVETGQERAAELWDDKGRDLFDQATDRATDYLGQAQVKAADYYAAAHDFIEENKDDWLGAFAGNAKALKHKAVAAAELAQQKADHAAVLAADKAAPYQKKAKKLAKKNSKKATKAKAKAVKQLQKKFG